MEIKWGVDGFLFLPGVKTSHESQSENSIVSHWCVVTEVVGNYDKPFLMGMGQVIGCVSFGSVWSPSEMLQRSGNGLFHSYFMVWYGSYPTWRWFILTQTHISVSDIYIYNYIYTGWWYIIIYMYTGWWFGTFFSIIYGIILPIDFHIFQRGWNHEWEEHG